MSTWLPGFVIDALRSIDHHINSEFDIDRPNQWPKLLGLQTALVRLP
jgi:hypothetical protein